MLSVLQRPYFHDEEAAYAKLESVVWPNGPICPHCGGTDRIRPLRGTAHRPGLKKCYACRKQFRVTVGTVFESSHIKLNVWLQAFYLLCSSKKGISSNQLARTLGVTLKTAWFMSHRVREAMRTGPLASLGGAGAIVEADETFIGQKKGVPKRRGYAHKHAVLSLVERGGDVRSFHIDGTSAADVVPVIKENVARESRMMTDEAGQYAHLRKDFAGHEVVRHGAGEYARDGAHTPCTILQNSPSSLDSGSSGSGFGRSVARVFMARRW
jgi:transposase-like protein